MNSETGHPRHGTIKFYRLSDMKEEWLNPKFSRRIISGKNEMIGYIVLLKGSIVPAHKHISEQISIILKGGLRFTINEKDTIVRESEVLVIPSNVEHSAVAVEDTISLDCFSPPREDWLAGTDIYLRDNIR